MGKSNIVWTLPDIETFRVRETTITRSKLTAIVNEAIKHAVSEYPDQEHLLRPERIREVIRTVPRITAGNFLIRTPTYQCGCPLTEAGNVRFSDSVEKGDSGTLSHIESAFYGKYDNLMPAGGRVCVVTDP